LEKEEAHHMTLVITGVKVEIQSKGLDRARCWWHVGYEFRGAEIAVYANGEAEPRRRAVEQLRNRGLKIAA
jgi:hypothetical protein